MNMRRLKIGVAAVTLLAIGLVLGAHEGDPVIVEIPAGATSRVVANILVASDVVNSAGLFHLYVRIRGADRRLMAGTYRLRTGSSMRSALRSLSRGEVETVAMTIPEGFRVQQMAPRIAEVTGATEAEVLTSLRDPSLVTRYAVPGPGVEGYLFPDTYRFAQGVTIEAVVETMIGRYSEIWTPERQARLEALELTEGQIVTLASIIQAEARQVDEMPRIAGVYHNRLGAGWLLQADPTVLYALGGYRERLLYAAIDSVEDNPYNTYSNRGLPPGPIGSPGERAIEAALTPEVHDFMYFVAWPDGSHVFTRSLTEHNTAKENARTARERVGS